MHNREGVLRRSRTVTKAEGGDPWLTNVQSKLSRLRTESKQGKKKSQKRKGRVGRADLHVKLKIPTWKEGQPKERESFEKGRGPEGKKHGGDEGKKTHAVGRRQKAFVAIRRENGAHKAVSGEIDRGNRIKVARGWGN